MSQNVYNSQNNIEERFLSINTHICLKFHHKYSKHILYTNFLVIFFLACIHVYQIIGILFAENRILFEAQFNIHSLSYILHQLFPVSSWNCEYLRVKYSNTERNRYKNRWEKHLLRRSRSDHYLAHIHTRSPQRAIGLYMCTIYTTRIGSTRIIYSHENSSVAS